MLGDEPEGPPVLEAFTTPPEVLTFTRKISLLVSPLKLTVSVAPVKDTFVTGAALPCVLTITLQAAVLPPSVVVTVIVAFPAPTPVTTPPVDTVATAVLLLLHVTFWFVAPDGVIAGIRVSVPPTPIDTDVLFRDTLVTATAVALTETLQVAVLLLSTVLTVIVAVPTLTPVTTPPVDTVATVESLLLHVTFLFVASEGNTAAVKVSVPPMKSPVDVFIVTPVTATVCAPPPPPPSPPPPLPSVVPSPHETNAKVRIIVNKSMNLLRKKRGGGGHYDLAC
jgi:hypothetical protein